MFLSCNNLASYWLCSSCRITVTAKSPSTRGRKTGNPPDSCVRSQILAPVRAMCVRGSVFVNKDHWVRMGYPSMPSHMPVIQRGKPSSAQRGETLKSPPQKKSGTRDVSLRPWAPGDARVLSAPCWRPAARGSLWKECVPPPGTLPLSPDYKPPLTLSSSCFFLFTCFCSNRFNN